MGNPFSEWSGNGGGGGGKKGRGRSGMPAMQLGFEGVAGCEDRCALHALPHQPLAAPVPSLPCCTRLARRPC